jgi:hypothetical protein
MILTNNNIMDVTKQSEIKDRTLSEYIDYIENRTSDHKTLNLISLELSKTILNSYILAPNIVREIDWIDLFYPLEKRCRGDYPQVQKYCLIGMKSSYTDFHVDFGGTSVWYHVLKGHKRFYLVAPTAENLNLYEQWIRSEKQSETFFGDLLEENQCQIVDLLEGQTLFIPAGWIHSVYTFEDSLVFGGNFLNSYSILRQLQVYGIETRSSVHKIYRFPYFKELNFYFLSCLLPFFKLQQKNQNKRIIRNDDDDSDDDSDDDNNNITIKNAITITIIFQQLPYLIKACETWVHYGDTNDVKFFTQATAKLTYHTPMDFVNDWWVAILYLAKDENIRSHIESIRNCEDVFEIIRSTEIQNGKLIKRDDITLDVFEVQRETNSFIDNDQLVATVVKMDNNDNGNNNNNNNNNNNDKTKPIKTRNVNLSKSFLKNYQNEEDDTNDNDYNDTEMMMNEDDIIDNDEENFEEGEEDFEDDDGYTKMKQKKRPLPLPNTNTNINTNTKKPNQSKKSSSSNARQFLLSKIGKK